MIFIIIPESLEYHYIYIHHGIEDISEDNPITIKKYLTSPYNHFDIMNFKSISEPTQVTIYIRARNPSTAVETTPAKITSYTDSTLVTKIDEDVIYAKTKIEDYGKKFIVY